jgi:peptidoglycan/xylan/chitin deacetylase (PgdA/CDA1 family)
MYHRFGSKNSPGDRPMPAAAFEEQLRYIRRQMRPCRLGDLITSLESGRPLGPHSVVLTVDDGFRDFVTAAVPLLEKYEVPATLFPITGFVERREWPWFALLDYLITKAKPGRYEIARLGNVEQVVVPESGGREGVWAILRAGMPNATLRQRGEYLQAVSAEFGVPIPPVVTEEYAPVGWRELRALDAELFEIGCHTAHHPNVSLCTDGELEEEVTAAKKMLEDKLQRNVDSFCYPNGKVGDYDKRTGAFLRAAGFRAGLLAHGGFVRRDADPMEITRIAAAHRFPHFLSGVSGLSTLRRRLPARA